MIRIQELLDVALHSCISVMKTIIETLIRNQHKALLET